MVPKVFYQPVYSAFYMPVYRGLHHLAQQSGLWLLLWVAPLVIIHSPQQSFMAPAEGIAALQGGDMLANNDWISLTWWGSLQFEQLPGLPWLIALSYHWFGPSELAARLPSMAASVVAIGLTWRLGQRLVPPSLGLWAASILAVMPLWMRASKLASPDVLVVSLALLAIWALLHSEAYPTQRIGWGLVAGLALSLGLVVGGAIALLPLIALLPYLIRGHRTHRHLANLGLYYGLGLGLIPTAIWLGRSVARYGPLPLHQLTSSWMASLSGGLWQVSTAMPGILQSPWVTAASLGSLLAAIVPWGGFALVGAVLVGRNAELGRRTLWLGYPGVLLGLLIGLKNPTGSSYLQVYPFVALLAAVGLNHLGRLFRSAAPRRYQLMVGLSWVAGVLGILLMSAGSAVLVTPGELIAADLRPYGWLGVAGGLGLLLPWLLAINRWERVTRQQQQLWQWSWLLGPWLLLAAAFATGIWGDFNPGVKLALQTPPVADVLAQNPVHFIQPGRDRDSVLLTVYTPHRGKPLGNWSQLPAEGYAWGSPDQVPLGEAYEVIATVDDWQLVKAPVMPRQLPQG
ncbi:glycosyltransferase family 39 protein [Nodosilinea sp. LEGE 07088]|uniref:ArnT family glycosyltransferase n=1 Tax=Nodosilinea sp. LEGE 07088 TaxID=2777968 RepID=UPI0019E8F7F5|nr:glycosyltransferase family 39 protein [Nodosilinea sp. LEGE 07088]MBE9141215.1 glycosyltransferase family 39 protein [Nodosilinea sp. LEGE 07088]